MLYAGVVPEVLAKQFLHKNYNSPSHLAAWTAYLLFFCSGLTTLFGLCGGLKCFTPAHMRQWDDYVREYCFINSTYGMGNMEEIHESKAIINERANLINHYQWNNMYFFVLALAWYFLYEYWYNCDPLYKNGSYVFRVIYDASRAYVLDEKYEEKRQKFKENAYLVQTFTVMSRKGTLYLMSYLLSPFIILLMAGLQFYLITDFANESSPFWGFHAVHKAIKQGNWTQLDAFPTVTFCDLSQAAFSNIHEHTIQCVLPMNLFNDKIYVLLWWYYMFLFMYIGFVAIRNLILFLTPSMRYKKLCEILTVSEREDKPVVKKFLAKLGLHGLLMLVLIHDYNGSFVSRDVALYLKKELTNLEPTNSALEALTVESRHLSPRARPKRIAELA